MAVSEIPFPGLYTDFYQLTMSQGYYKTGVHRKKAHFDYFFRSAPYGGEYVIFAGLSDLLATLETYHFESGELEWMSDNGFDREFLNYLKTFQFNGTITSVPEGEVVFPNEPVLTVSGPLISCQLIESLLLNILNFQSLIATKASRLRLVSGNRKLADFGLRRAHGTGSFSATRAAFIGGIDATSNVSAGYRLNVPVSGTMAHSWIQCFDSELEAFRHYAGIYPDNCILLVDTYDTLHSGIPNAITVAKELEERGHRLAGIRLDSGNQLELSRMVRSMLDEAGLPYVLIAVSDQVDENRILSLLQKEAPVDLFGVGTRLITGHPDGALSGVYKMCALDRRPTMKITEELSKSNLPGVKEVFRESDDNGMFRKDQIVLSGAGETTSGAGKATSGTGKSSSGAGKATFETGNTSSGAEESMPGTGKALTGTASKSINGSDELPETNREMIRSTVMESGHIHRELPGIHNIASYCKSRMSRLPEKNKRITDPECYNVELDVSLKTLIENIKRKQA